MQVSSFRGSEVGRARRTPPSRPATLVHMTSGATTVADYLESLPAERREAIAKVREVIRKNLPRGLVEAMQHGMIGYVVPHEIYPAGYHVDPKQPLCYAALASQKNHMALYLSPVYQDPELEAWLRAQYSERGIKLDMGKSCIRFKRLDQIPLEVIGVAVAKVPVADFVARYEAVRPKKK